MLDAQTEGEAAHVSTLRTLARLVGRGMLEPHPRRGWYLTEAGVRWCAAWVDEEEVA